ncbi:MAG: hypothetical protein U9P79_04165 [Candidatus Cloacimonadota bacterium]|nr:hypothetical protein [Candidatus Cloacimonadota bacterium]
MGKLVLIVVMSLIVIFGAIMVSIGNRSTEIPELLSKKQAEILGTKLANFALTFAIRNLIDNKVDLSPDTTINYGYNNFAILNGAGSIDSIIYNMNSSLDTVQVICKVSYTVAGNQNHQKRSANLKITSSGATANLDKAIVTNGTIKQKAKASITGGILENQSLTLQDIFGVSKADLKSLAMDDYSYFVNPGNHQAIGTTLTWMDGDFHPSSYWTGSGILIVDGDFKMSAHAQFDGILIVYGNFETTAWSNINGAIAILSTNESELKAHVEVVKDTSLVQGGSIVVLNNFRQFQIINLE